MKPISKINLLEKDICQHACRAMVEGEGHSRFYGWCCGLNHSLTGNEPCDGNDWNICYFNKPVVPAVKKTWSRKKKVV